MSKPQFNPLFRSPRLASGGRAWNVLAAVCWVVGLAMIASNVSADDDKKGAAVSQIVKELKSAVGAFDADPSIENRVRVATWKVLLAEVVTERGDGLSLWSVALDQFDEGLAELTEIENLIAKDPDLERKLSETPALAMRLDAARVRQAAAGERQQLARTAERSRLNQLRNIGKSYRDLLTKMSEADLHLRLEDYDRARQANLEVLDGISKIYQEAGSRTDYHLFDDEPPIDGDGDLKVVESRPAPLNVDIIAYVKSMQALATCRMALSKDAVDRTLLEDARLWANAALSGDAVPATDLPAGHSADNPIGHYVLGLVNETNGTETTRKDPASAELHGLAAPLFKTARQHYDFVAKKISEEYADNAALAGLATEVSGRIKSIDSAAASLLQSDKQTTDGRPHESWATLQNTAVRHRDKQVWLAMVEAGRRGGIPDVDLQKAITSATTQKVLPSGDTQSQTLLTKVATERVWNQIGQQGAANMSAERRGQLQALLRKQADMLRATLSSEKDEVTLSQGQAFLALAIAYESILSAGGADESLLLRESYRLARDAMAVLEPAIALAKSEMEAIGLREALIASRLAYGHVSSQVLPDYRDDALLAFAAAFDEMARLPFRKGDLSILGSPMITAMSGRAGDSGTKLAIEERRYRELVTRFLEGMYTLQFGNAGAAADQMATALRLAKQSGGEPGQAGPRDAATMLGQTDGFDAQVTLHDSVGAFKILADVKADRFETALVESIQLQNPNSSVARVDDVNEAVLDDALNRIQSPLVGFALANSIEGYVNSLELEDDPRQVMLLAKAGAAFGKVEELLRSRRMQTRYPHIVAVVNDARQRLGSADKFRDEALAVRGRGDLSGAIKKLVAGLKLHPKSDELWQLYLETQIEQARRGGASEEVFNRLLDRIAYATRIGVITKYQNSYYNAVLYERLGRVRDSLGAYEFALASADQPRDRIRARSKVSEMRVRLAANNE